MEKLGKKVSHYTIEKELGNGMFAHVYLVSSDIDGKKYALKCVNKSVTAHYHRRLTRAPTCKGC
jgi:serine/threonine protein kinase